MFLKCDDSYIGLIKFHERVDRFVWAWIGRLQVQCIPQALTQRVSAANNHATDFEEIPGADQVREHHYAFSGAVNICEIERIIRKLSKMLGRTTEKKNKLVVFA